MMTNTFAYRLPNGNRIVRGESPILIKGFGEEGFVIAPFADPQSKCFTIPFEGDINITPFVPDNYNIPSKSTTEAAHAGGVNMILDSIRQGKLNKCVLAKVMVEEREIDIESTFNALCNARPDAFVFHFHTPRTGTWIGASPELLLRSKNGMVDTMSLAGTREAGTNKDWDDKDIMEQQIVTDFISECFRSTGFDPHVGQRVTHLAGNVEHLMTPIESKLTGNLSKLLFTLSPTPALCGEPRDEAMGILSAAEEFDRGYYGGFCGPVTKRGKDFDLYVNLRSMCIEEGRCCIFAGGGIVEGSVAADEWLETERKAKTILQNINER